MGRQSTPEPRALSPLSAPIGLAGHVVSLGAIAVIFVLLALSAPTRAFDPDEFQHLQMSWLIANGQIPYRDYFEHHTPLFHLLASTMLHDPRLTTDGDAAVAMLTRLRLIDVALGLVAVGLTEAIGRRCVGPLAARCAAVLLASFAVFAMKTVEIRPDPLALVLFLTATFALVQMREARRPAIWAIVAGAAAMLALLTTQKLVFALPGLALTFYAGAAAKQPLRLALFVTCGALIAAAPVLLWFAQAHALVLFIHDNFLLGAKWPRDSRPLIMTLSALLRDETLALLVAAMGTLALIVRGRRVALWPLAVAAPLVSLGLLMPVFPVVQPQYLLMFLPYLALLGGVGMAAIVVQSRARMLAAVAVIGAVGVHGALVVKTQSTARDEDARASLRYVVTQTVPDATVMRAWSPGVAFRRPAFFYFSLHPEIRAVVPPQDWQRLAVGLRDGRIAPELIEMDDAMRAMPPEIVRVLESGWAPTGTGTLWRRKPAAQ